MDLVLLQARLTDAQEAYHKLVTGTSVLELRDSNGELVKYYQGNIKELNAYIISLQVQLGVYVGTGPMRVSF
jgi:hypothetical protein